MFLKELSPSGNTPKDIFAPVPFQLKETVFDDICYVCPNWEQMGKYNFGLAKQIINSELSFDRIVALARGGWTWTRDLADALNIPDLSSVRIKSYSNVNESSEAIIVQPLADPINGQRILLFDEVIDSGHTFVKALRYLKEMGAKDIQTAALCYKPRSVYKPNFYAFKTDAWVVFPHEIREFIEISTQKWRSKGLSTEMIKDRLITIGIPVEQVDFYCSLNLK
jgi:uncharacterized protein